MSQQNRDRTRSSAAGSARAYSGDALGGALGRQSYDAGYSSRDDLQRFARPQPRGQGPVRKASLRTQRRPKFDRDRYANLVESTPVETAPVNANLLAFSPSPVSDSALDRLLAARAARDTSRRPGGPAETGGDAVVVELPLPRRVPEGGVSVALHNQDDRLPAEAFYDPTSYSDEEAARHVEELQRQFTTADEVAVDYQTEHPGPAAPVDQVGIATDAAAPAEVAPAVAPQAEKPAAVDLDAHLTDASAPATSTPAEVSEPEPKPAAPGRTSGGKRAAEPAAAELAVAEPADPPAEVSQPAAAALASSPAAASVSSDSYRKYEEPVAARGDSSLEPFEPVPSEVAAYEAEMNGAKAPRRGGLYVLRRVLMFAAIALYAVAFLGFLVSTVQGSASPLVNTILLVVGAIAIIPVCVPDRHVGNPVRANLARIPGYAALLALVALSAAGFTAGNLVMGLWPVVVFVSVALMRFSPAKR